jgi:hypothetical protein
MVYGEWPEFDVVLASATAPSEQTIQHEGNDSADRQNFLSGYWR